MARTRQQTKTTSSSVIAASSDEEQREPEVFYTPVASKKPIRGSETPEIDSDTFYTPATKDASTKLPLRKKLSKSPRKRIVVEVPVSQEIRDLAAGASATPQSGRESGKITGGKAKRVEMLVDQLDKESSATTLSKSTKILATDDAVEEEETTRQDKEAIGSVVADSQEDGSDDDDDDDDAPEVVNTNVAMHAARQRDLNASTASKV